MFSAHKTSSANDSIYLQLRTDRVKVIHLEGALQCEIELAS